MSQKTLIPGALIALLLLFPGRPVRALDATCRTVLDAMTREKSTPTHIYATETSRGSGGKPRNIETIYTPTAAYIQVHGQWKRSPLSIQAMRQQQDENIRTARSLSCRYLRDEAAGGETAAVYSAQMENEGVKSAATLWISKRTGLPLKSDNTIDTGDSDKIHMTIRYEYTNVQAPAGVK